MLKVGLNLRKAIAMAIFLAGSVTMFAQDVIMLKNGYDIQAVVQEVGIDEVKYKRFDNQNGPNYTLKKSNISMIRYENGSEDVFGEAEEKAEVKAEAEAKAEVEAEAEAEEEVMASAPKVQRPASRRQRINSYNRNTEGEVEDEGEVAPEVRRTAPRSGRRSSYNRVAGEETAPASEVRRQPAVSYQTRSTDWRHNMALDAPDLYRNYRSGSVLKNIGMGLTLGGLGVVVASVIIAETETVKEGSTMIDDFSGTGSVLASVGTVCVLAGTPLWIIGGTKKRIARNAYLRDYGWQPPAQPAPRLEIQTTGNSMGLAFVF
ncbi:MAG: hypothetical protein LBE91_09495 [Tannerella sp.]|nr:hypothetical protein [Tannerella sp.]